MIQLVIAWTCVGVFVATALITLLALVRVIRLAEKKYLDRLFKALVLEIVAVCIGIFTGKIELPKTVEDRVMEKGEVAGRETAVDALKPEISRLSNLVVQRDAIINRDIAKPDLSPAERESLKQPLKLDPEVVNAALGARATVRPR